MGRIRYLGNVLYDADRIEEMASRPDLELVDAQRELILDPFDPAVIEAARNNGVHDSIIDSAQKSPAYRFVKEWGLALPLHVEFRTFPMLFYVPPLMPVISNTNSGYIRNETEDLFADIEKARIPIQFLGKMFAAGNDAKVRYALRKQYAVRMLRRHLTVGDVDAETAERALREADCSREEADEIYRLTSLPTAEERFVIPPAQREMAIEMLEDPREFQRSTGFGFRSAPARS